ncbi:acetyl-CoA hydrolase/transferase C-terminal domain-containing protein [Bradyrhizobium sp. AS23.2]|uniref:acetyl-CoA hydrolase/transferase family protein n=1 Tax=Bradyrhizobium sp. AS23.2 TaxID=1680155 RepID=UPI00093C9A68|nr:acetyl-CoA hydrolase/transferase C-terminal domain-containing protein [Bradyrhizobium sp. AS23.2]OKO83098.1 4-hydroxybutyrate CoA-transferase [Bradyrhizobium sp. AS23.2]
MKHLATIDELDLPGIVRPGDRIIFSQGTAEPRTLTERLVAQKDELPKFEVFLGAQFSDTFHPDRTAGISFAAYGALGRTAALAKAGRLSVIPSHYGWLCQAFARGEPRADIAFLQLSPAQGGRRCSLSLANDIAAQAALHARVIIAEVNPDAPWTYGAELPRSLAPHFLIEARNKPLELPPPRVGPTEQAIGRLVAELIPDGATLQFGVGTIPDAVLAQLSGHRDIGIHSGQIGDGVVPLIERGVITNAKKPFNPGVSVCGSLFGTRRLYDFAHRNPAISVGPPTETHNLDIMAKIDAFVSINSAIEVDLTGQVNAEETNGTYIGGLGGQLDFMRGANASRGGRAIIALPATARDGAISRIVPSVTTVTCPRGDVDAIITEFGVAELRGKSLEERRRSMIAIAAPQFRDQLAAPRE